MASFCILSPLLSLLRRRVAIPKSLATGVTCVSHLVGKGERGGGGGGSCNPLTICVGAAGREPRALLASVLSFGFVKITLNYSASGFSAPARLFVDASCLPNHPARRLALARRKGKASDCCEVSARPWCCADVRGESCCHRLHSPERRPRGVSRA